MNVHSRSHEVHSNFPPANVAVYVRHANHCPHQGDDSYPKCSCVKWLRWSSRGQQHRRAAGTRSWNQASNIARDVERRVRDGEDAPLVKSKASPVTKPTIAEAVETFLLAKAGQNIGNGQLRKLRYQMGLLEAFVTARSRQYAEEITRQDLIDFRASWPWADSTRIKMQGNVRTFLRFACKGDHRTELLDALGTIKQTREGRERRKPKPLTEEQLKILLAQVPISFASEPLKIPRVLAFVKGAVSTGLACTDMAHLERASLESAKNGILVIERRKTGRKAMPRISEDMRRELLAVTNGNARYVFHDGVKLPHSATAYWQYDLRQLFDDAGLRIKGNLAHRFRDTFVDFMLGEGYDLTDIAAMLGDTLAVVEQHYADLASNRMAERLLKKPARSWN